MKRAINYPRVVILLIFLMGTASAQHINYDIRFGSKPREIIYENTAALEFKVNFGGFPLKLCNFYVNCQPPPVSFCVIISWQNPNDIFGDPDC